MFTSIVQETFKSFQTNGTQEMIMGVAGILILVIALIVGIISAIKRK